MAVAALSVVVLAPLTFLESLPAGSVHGRMRMTEQGETIAQNIRKARHLRLEQLQAGVVSAFLREKDLSDERA